MTTQYKIQRPRRAVAWFVVMSSFVVIAAVPVKQQVPPSTNPTERVIYPGEDQTPEQQMTDQLECYNWATQQTSWDPHQGYAELQAKHGAANQQADAAQGEAIRGAARGAAAGAVIGAIAGDAGQGAAIGAASGGMAGGMRSRRTRKAAESSIEQDTAAFQEKVQAWDRNYVACMQARKYVVN